MKVSILIPVYNSQRYLRSTILSALGQSWNSKEIIIVDDGSTDESLSIARSYESDVVRVFTQSNGGACKARNRAYSECSGDYIQYLDADDMLSSNKVSNQIQISSLDNRTVLSCRFTRFFNEDIPFNVSSQLNSLDRSWSNPVDWLVNAWMGNGMGQTSIWLTPRRLIEQAGPWDERLSINQDGEFFCRVLLQAQRIQFSSDSMVYYRSGNRDSVSQNISHKKASSLLLSYRLNSAHLLEKENSERVKIAVASKYLSFIYTYYDLYPDLANEAENYCAELGIKKLPLTGGKNFKIMASLLGFDNSLKVRSFLRKVVK